MTSSLGLREREGRFIKRGGISIIGFRLFSFSILPRGSVLVVPKTSYLAALDVNETLMPGLIVELSVMLRMYVPLAAAGRALAIASSIA